MKKTIAIILLAIAALPTTWAQTDVALDTELGGRLSFQADKKVAPHLRLGLAEELRFDNNFAAFDRSQTTLSLAYKPNKQFKFGVGYALILPYSQSNTAFKSTRHRLMADAAGNLRFGLWRLSLKERLQATLRAGDMNLYQNPRVVVALKSRLKLEYKGLRRWTPYISTEMRHRLNAPSVSAIYDGTYYLTPALSQYGSAGWFLGGYNKVRLDRLRSTIGATYRLNQNSSLDICFMADWVSDMVIDANAAGTRLKNYTREQGTRMWLVVGYDCSL